MEKVVGSSPIIRFTKALETGPFFVPARGRRRAPFLLEAAVATVPPRMRRILALSACVLSAAIPGAAHGAPPPACQTPEVRQHDEAVFAHVSSRAQGVVIAARARKLGFLGIKIEAEGCGDYEVEIDGADSTADRVSFAQEAMKAGFPVTFEQTGPPMQPPRGQKVGVFAHLATLKAANALATRLATIGFPYIDIVWVSGTWEVVMPQVPASATASITAEVQHAGFHITFATH